MEIYKKYCTSSGENLVTDITKTSQEVLYYLLADGNVREQLLDTSRSSKALVTTTSQQSKNQSAKRSNDDQSDDEKKRRKKKTKNA